MAELDNRVGVDAKGDTKRVWPKRTISGRAYDRRKVTTFRGIGNGQFVIVDNVLPPGFDMEAEIAKLTGRKSSPIAATKDSE